MNPCFRNIICTLVTLMKVIHTKNSELKKARLSSCPTSKFESIWIKIQNFTLTLLTMILIKLGRFFHALASLRSLMYKLIIFPCCVASSPAFDEVDIYVGHFLSKCWTPVKSIDLRGNKVGMAKSDIRQKKD